MKKLLKISPLILTSFFTSCDIKTANQASNAQENYSDYLVYTIESATTELDSQASAIEGSNSFVDLPGDFSGESLAGTCSYVANRTTCQTVSGIKTRNINWNYCVAPNSSVVLNGGWKEVYSGNSASSCSPLTSASSSITRTTLSGGQTKSYPSGAVITTDTNGGTAYNGDIIPNTGILASTPSDSTIRSININGIHKKMVINSSTIYDHYLRTGTALSFIGLKSTGTRTLTGGSIIIYHQILKYMATHTYSNVKWESPNCCHPTTGTVSIAYSGSISGTASLEFNGCGTAVYTNTINQKENIKLYECN